MLEDADIFIQNSDLSNFENLVFKYGDNLAKADVSDYVNILKETNLTAKDISFLIIHLINSVNYREYRTFSE